MQFSIHQFSRGLTPTQNQRGEWVSGGFGAEIANESFDVPEEIKQAVTLQEGGWRGLRIPDTHPPKPSEIALIARDLGKYCVLAVANRLKDDTVPREFVGYRYFWLDKTQFQNHPNGQNVDGIWTLLWYWQDKGQPQYNIEELQTKPSSYTTSWDNLALSWLFEHWQQQHYQRIQELLSDIRPSHQPLIYEATEIGGQLTYQEVHCLAIKYYTVNRGYINWAWNVRKLENPRGLNVIYCADAEALQLFNRQFPSRVIIPTPAPTPTPTSTSSLQGGMTASPTARASATRNQSEVTKCLKNFLNKDFRSQDILQLINFYQEYGNNIGDFAEQTEINKINESNPQPFAIQYATLITALASNNNNGKIFDKLMHLNEQQKMVAIKFLVDLQQMAGQNDSCSQHPYFLKFSYDITNLQNKLFKSLKPKGSNFSLSNILKQITQSKPPFLIFFFLLLAGSAGLIYWQWPNIISVKSPEKNPGNTVSSPSATSTPTPGSLAKLLDNYERLYQAMKLLEKNQPDIKENVLKEIENSLENHRKTISNELGAKKNLFDQDLKGESTTVQNARKQTIYTDMKTLTTLVPEKVTLPFLRKPDSQNLASGAGDKENVTMLQKALKRGKYYTRGQEESDPSGTFGEATETAVKNAQQKRELPENERDGVVSDNTWQVLRGRLEDEQVETVYQTLKEHLNKGNTDYNIVTQIKKCRDDNKDKDDKTNGKTSQENQKDTIVLQKDTKVLHFGSCLEKIGTPKNVTGGNAGNKNNTQATK